MEFEWDDRKNQSNQQAHGVSFEEASFVFEGDYINIFDFEHSLDEDRFIAIGLVPDSKFLFVVYTIRYGDTFRIISARRATKRESADYILEYGGAAND